MHKHMKELGVAVAVEIETGIGIGDEDWAAVKLMVRPKRRKEGRGS